jgi:N-acyl-D-aspartate/D-glutamate deacylase
VLDNSSNYRAHTLVRNIWEDKPITLPTTHLITNVNVIDGTGLPAFAAGVRILNDRIRDIGALAAFPNERVTDGKGKVLAPGFIDSHSHHDKGLQENPSALAATNQGITPVVVGQDGGSVPINDLIQSLNKTAVSVNVASYTGQVWLRGKFMKGSLQRKATDSEIDSMKILLAREMELGSLGLGTGLEYESAFYSTRDEVVALAKVAAAKGGRYISHLRSEDINLEESIDANGSKRL